MSMAPTRYGGDAAARDRFLVALDDRDGARAKELGRNLSGCTNPLPSTTCLELGLPVGSTYAMAAELLIDGSWLPIGAGPTAGSS